MIDFHDPEAAAAEIVRAKGLGAVGVMAPGMVDRESITAPRFEPIWAAAEDQDLGVGVHVSYCTPMDTYAFVYSVLMGCEQVMASGVLDRHPGLRVAFLETSCNWVPFMIERLEEKANPERRRYKPDRPLDTTLDRPEQGGYLAELTPAGVHRPRQPLLRLRGRGSAAAVLRRPLRRGLLDLRIRRSARRPAGERGQGARPAHRPEGRREAQDAARQRRPLLRDVGRLRPG